MRRTNEVRVPLHIILKCVCYYFRIDDEMDVFQKTRKREVVIPRMWFHYFARKTNPMFSVSLTHIASYKCDKDRKPYNHATILHSIKKIQGYIDAYKQDLQTYLDIKYLINLETSTFEPIKQGNCAHCNFKIKTINYEKNIA